MPALVKSLRALSDPTRLRLLLLLIEEEVTVAELQEILGMGQSRISASLSLLKREGLTAARRVGKNIFYSSRPEMVEAIRPILDAASRELPEASRDSAALALTLHKRKDKAAEYFNKLAGKFGRTYIPGRSWQALAHGLLRLLPPMVIADLGAGEGTLSQLLARSARQVIAIDNSEKMVEFGGALARDNGFENLEYRLGDIEEPPIDSDSVDLALFSQALHHAASPARAVKSATAFYAMAAASSSSTSPPTATNRPASFTPTCGSVSRRRALPDAQGRRVLPGRGQHRGSRETGPALSDHPRHGGEITTGRDRATQKKAE